MPWLTIFLSTLATLSAKFYEWFWTFALPVAHTKDFVLQPTKEMSSRCHSNNSLLIQTAHAIPLEILHKQL